MTTQTDTLTTVRSFVMERFPEARTRRLADDESLLESGVVDSLGILEFVTFLEERFSVALEDDDLTPEHFDSVSAIASFVDAQR